MGTASQYTEGAEASEPGSPKKIPVFVEIGSVQNPEDLPDGYVFIYIDASARHPVFGPIVW